MKKLDYLLLLTAFAVLICCGACSAVPGAPTILWPGVGVVVESNVPDIKWNSGSYTAYEVHIGTTNDPNNPNGWDSGTVWTPGSTGGSAMSGYLTPQVTYYVFVRLYDASGWGPWSAYGNNFYVNGQFLNDPYPVASGGLQWYSSVAYNPTRNEYCITWQNGYVIHWRRLDSTGANIGSDMILYDDSAGHHFSRVCYNSARAEYLIEYVVWMGDNTNQVRAIRVDANTGNRIGGYIFLYATGMVSTTWGINVAYSPTSNSYLAVYEAASEGGIVYGRILDTYGNPVGSQIRISPPGQLYSRTPAVAWNSAANEFLVTYQGYIAEPSWDYWAQRIRASDGALLGSNLQISANHDVANGGVAYDPVLNRYLVVYEAGGGGSPWGQFVSAAPALIGSRFAIGGGDFLGWGPSVCWDSSKSEFLVAWSAGASSSNFARRVHQTGACIGETFRLNANWIGIGNWPPQPVYNSVNNEFLIHWYNSYETILDRRYKSYVAPPSPVTNFAATSGNGQVNLTWTNPTVGGFTGTLIRFKTTGYPTSPTDGSLVVDKAGTAGANDNYLHSGLTNGVTYYYTAYAHDSVPFYATGVNTSSIPTAPVCFQDSFSYPDGNLNGQGGWSGSAGSNIAVVSGTVKITGGLTSQDAVHTTACSDPGAGYMLVSVKVQSGVGVDYMWDLWIDDLSNLNLARWYGAGTTARGRIGSTTSVTATQTLTGGWDELKVKINPYANTTEFFFNGASLGVLDHGQTGAGDVIGRLRFTRGTSTVVNGNYLFFDDITIGETQSPYAGVINLPGTVQAENFDNGGESLAYHDTTSGNSGGAYRTTDVDIESCSEGGYNVGWIDTSEWLEYTVNVASGGLYDINMRTASPNNGCSVHIEMNGGDVTGNRALPNTGGWQTWTTTTFSGISLNAGQQIMRVCVDGGGFNFNYLGVAVSNDTTPPGNVTNFTATPGDMQNNLSWTNPGDPDLAGVKIVFKTTGYPTSQSDGTQVYNGLGTSVIHGGLTNGVLYYYKAFSYDEVPNYSSGSQASATPADTTPPGDVTGFTVTPGDMQNSLSWTNPGGDFTGTKILFKTTGYPTSASDGTTIYDSNGASTNHTSLTNGVLYYYKAFAHDEVPNYAAGVTGSGTPADVTPPGNVTGFTATSGDMQNSLSWTNPGDSDLAGIKIMFKTTGYPTGPADGAQCYSGTGTSTVHGSLTNGTPYYYKAFAFDEVPNYASGAQSTATPADVTPPGPVTGFTATPGDTQVSLSWTNPGGDFTGTKILFKTTGYPTGPADGASIYDSNGTITNHTGLTNGVTYYYGAYAHDEVPNYASGAQANATPVSADVTAPTFGGSITPSLTNTLTPTITITVQDTESGLNVGSAEFAYSVDGGNTFVTYVGRYTLHSIGTGSGGGNQYWYPDFYHPTSYTIASGDHLQYDIYLNNTDGKGAVDLEGSFGNLRDSGILDQNGLSGHPNTNLYSRAYHQWYHRDFDLSSKAGQTITAYEMGHETDNGVSEFYVRNVIIVNNGQVKDKAANSDAWVPVSDTVGPGNNGYSSTVGPEMLPSDPASPASCTGTNGTTAQQTVSAMFSDRLMSLVPGNTNRIKFHMSDMNGNMRISSVFTITIDTTAPTVTINQAGGQADPTNASPINFTVVFSESVSDFATGDVTLSGTAGATTAVVTGSDTTYNVAVSGMTGNGTVIATLNAGVAHDAAGNGSAASTSTDNTVTYQVITQSPYAGVIALPGTVQAENFDNGGEGVAYHDLTSGNSGGAYRSTDVDIEATGDTGGGYNVGWIDTGEWLEYTVNVASSGQYAFQVRSASPNAGCAIHIEMNGGDVTGVRSLPNTGGWQTYQTTTISGISLSAGQQIMRVYVDAGGFNLNKIDVVTSPVTISNSAFNSDADGWTITTWRASTAYGYGTMQWLSSGAGNPGGGMRCSGSGTTDNTDRCNREGGEISKTISTVGYSNIKVSYQLDVNTLGQDRTGTGSGSCAVDHNLIDEQLTVFYTTNGSTWTEAEYMLRSTLLGSYQNWGTRVIDLTGVSACNNNPNFGLRFRWQVNSTADQANLDNIVVTAN